MCVQVMAHLKVSPETLPRHVTPYPRVVRNLYDDSREEGGRGTGGMRGIEEDRKTREGTGKGGKEVYIHVHIHDIVHAQIDATYCVSESYTDQAVVSVVYNAAHTGCR